MFDYNFFGICLLNKMTKRTKHKHQNQVKEVKIKIKGPVDFYRCTMIAHHSIANTVSLQTFTI